MSTSIQLSNKERQSQTIATVLTVLIHAAILAGLWWLVMMPPNPPLGGGGPGMAISLGEENMGGPSMIPVEDPAVQQPQPEPDQTEEQPVLTSETDESPVVEEKKETPKKKPDVKPIEKPIEQPKEIKKPIEQPERKVDERSMFRKKNNSGNDASGRGTGDVPGNQGNENGTPDGDPNGNGGTGNGGSGGGTTSGNGPGNGPGSGPGSGGGIDGIGSFDLKGRALTRRPNIEDNSRETGKVVVSIVVDRSGRVLKATAGQKGSTTLNPILLEKAKQAALNSGFSARADGPDEQFGTITIFFRFKQ